MRKPEEFRNQAIKLNINYWEHHRCAICEEPVGYYFFTYPDCEVVFDSGCGCSFGSNLRPSSENAIKQMDEFWKWENKKKKKKWKN